MTVAEKLASDMLKNYEEVATYISKQESYPDLPPLLEICAAFQASNTDC